MKRLRAAGYIFILLAIVAATFVSGCATTSAVSSADTEAKKKYITAGKLYALQYKLYVSRQDVQGMTEAEKKLMKARWEILNAMKPLLDLYAMYIDGDQVPPCDIMDKLWPLYLQLTDIVKKGG